MQLESNRSNRHRVAKPALAGLLACLLLLSGIIAATPSLHQSFHDNQNVESQSCVVCLLATGQVNFTAILPILSVFSYSLVLLVLIPKIAQYSNVDRRIFFSRGPPSALLVPCL